MLTTSADLFADAGRERAAAERRGALPMETMVKSNEIIPINDGVIKMPRTIATPSLTFLCLMGPFIRVLSKSMMDHFDGRTPFYMKADCGIRLSVYITYGPGRTFADYAHASERISSRPWKHILNSDFSKFDLCQIEIWQLCILMSLSNFIDRHPDFNRSMRRVWQMFCSLPIEFRVGELRYIWTVLMASGRFDTSLMGTLIGLLVNLNAILRSIKPLATEGTADHSLHLREFGDDNFALSTVNVDTKSMRSILTSLGFETKLEYGPYESSSSPRFVFLGAMAFIRPSLHFAPAPGRVFSKLFQYHSTNGPQRDRFFEKIAAYVPASPASPGLHEFVLYVSRFYSVGHHVPQKHPDVIKPRDCNLPQYTDEDLKDFLEAYDMPIEVFRSFIRSIPGMFQRGVYEHEFFNIIFRVEGLGPI